MGSQRPPGPPGPPPRTATRTTPPSAATPAPDPDDDPFVVPDVRPARSAASIRAETWDLLGQPLGLRVDDVSRLFKSGDVHVAALENVSFEVAPGEFVAITGPSGGGKSTLLALLGGLDRPSKGRVYAAGAALDQVGRTQLDDYRLQRVGIIFQTFNLVASLTAEDNVALPMLLAGVPLEERRQRARRLLELVGMGHRARVRGGRLSGGEQQRVAVARSLANRPGLILADEPTGNLDSSRGAEVLDLLQELNRHGCTVILVTHDPEVARRADRAIRLRDGKVVPGVQSPRRTGRAPEQLDPPRRLSRTDAVKLGLQSTGRRPLRTAITAAGVAIGIGVMSMILSLAAGLQQQVVDTVTSDTQLQTVDISGPLPGGQARPLDSNALANLETMNAVQLGWGQTIVGGTLGPDGGKNPPQYSVVGLPPQRSHSPRSDILAAGSLPSADAADEVVLTVDQARKFGWSPSDAVGKKMKFTGLYPGPPGTGGQTAAKPQALELTVVGVANGAPGGDPNWAMLPYETANVFTDTMRSQNNWSRDPYVGIRLLADSLTHVTAVRDEAQQAGYSATTNEDELRAFAERLNYVELALAGLAIIALAVAALGIANTMFSAVLERTREIGVFKALGSRARDMALIFVAESGLIGIAGGIAGVLVSALLAKIGNDLIDRIAQSQGSGGGLHLFDLNPLIGLAAIVVAIGISALSGLLPAVRASRLDPVQAIRYE
jgi:ABC-type lipoprotein export system ATPase subunit/ABC-type lipoprotein release transport system permease subunit